MYVSVSYQALFKQPGDTFKLRAFKEDGVKYNNIPVYSYNHVSIHTQDSPMSPNMCI